MPVPDSVETVGSSTKYVYGSAEKPQTIIYTAGSKTKEDTGAEAAGIRSVLLSCDTFQFFKIASGKGQSYSNKWFDPKMMFPHEKRLGHVFLSMLGRSGDDLEEAIPLCPAVSLSTPLSHRTDLDTEVVLSHKTVDSVAKREIDSNFLPDAVWRETAEAYSKPDLPDALRIAPEHAVHGPPAKNIYGPGEFKISIREIQELERSISIATSPVLPQMFYAHLVAFTTKCKRNQLFFDLRRSVPLEEFSQVRSAFDAQNKELLAIWLSRQNTALASEKGLYEEQARVQKEYLADATGDADLLDKVHDVNQRIGRFKVVSRNAQIKVAHLTSSTAQDADFAVSLGIWSFIAQVRTNPSSYGFSGGVENITLKKSLTELCTDVCISQKGYFFVDGRPGAPNQLTAKTAQQIVFLSSPGLDFCDPSSTRLEGKKYFQTTEDGNGEVRLTAFLQNSWTDLLERVIRLYRVIYRSCRHHQVRNPSMLAMGLGVFLENVPQAEKTRVAEAYFIAQWLLLTEEDWGFENYFINPVWINATALPTLERVLKDGRSLKCNVVMHDRDVKFLCVEMAKTSTFSGPAMLNPSDCASMWLGHMGYFWEKGRQDGYVGEEDFCSSGTGLLALSGITNAYGLPDRHLAEETLESPKGKRVVPTLENVLAPTSGTSAVTQLAHLCTLISTTPDDVVHLNTLAQHSIERHSEVIKEYYKKGQRSGDAMVLLTKVCATPGASLGLVKLMVEKLELALEDISCPCQGLQRPASRRSMPPMFLQSLTEKLKKSDRGDVIAFQEDEKPQFKDCSTPLHAAARFGHVDILLYLVLNGHPVTLFERPSRLSIYEVAASTQNKSPLLATACCKLLRAAESKTSLHPLLTVASSEEAATFRTIPVGALNKYGWNIVHWATALNNIHLLQRVMLVEDLDLNAMDGDGWCALHWVVVRGSCEMLKVLLSSKQNIDVCTTSFAPPLLLERFSLAGGMWTTPEGDALCLSEQLHHGVVPPGISSSHPGATVFKGHVCMTPSTVQVKILLVMEPPSLVDGSVRQRGCVKKISEHDGAFRFNAFFVEYDVRSMALKLTQGNVSLQVGPVAASPLSACPLLFTKAVLEARSSGKQRTTALHAATRLGLCKFSHILAQYEPRLLDIPDANDMKPFLLALLHFQVYRREEEHSRKRGLHLQGSPLGKTFVSLVLSAPAKARKAGHNGSGLGGSVMVPSAVLDEVRRKCIISLKESCAAPFVDATSKGWLLQLIEKGEETAVLAMVTLLQHEDLYTAVRSALLYALHNACAFGSSTKGDTTLVTRVLSFISAVHKVNRKIAFDDPTEKTVVLEEAGATQHEETQKNSITLQYLRQDHPTEGELREAERDLGKRLWCSRYIIAKGFDKLVRGEMGVRSLYRSGVEGNLRKRVFTMAELKAQLARVQERNKAHLFLSTGLNTNDGDRIVDNLLSLHTSLEQQNLTTEASELSYNLLLILQAHCNGVESSFFVAARFQRIDIVHHVFKRYAEVSETRHGMGLGVMGNNCHHSLNVSLRTTKMMAAELKPKDLLREEIRWRRWQSAEAVLPYAKALHAAETPEAADAVLFFDTLPSGELRTGQAGAEKVTVYAEPPCLQELVLCSEHRLVDPSAFSQVLACHAMWLTANDERPKSITIKYEQRKLRCNVTADSTERGNIEVVCDWLANDAGVDLTGKKDHLRFVSAGTHFNVILTYENVTDGQVYMCSIPPQRPQKKTVSLVALATGETRDLVIIDRDVTIDVSFRVRRRFRVPDTALVEYFDAASGAQKREMTYTTAAHDGRYSVQFSGNLQLTWSEVSRTATPHAAEATATLRYLFGTKTVNLSEFFANHENRVHFPFFDFGDRTSRTGELMLVICHQLSLEEAMDDLSEGVPLFSEGFSICDVTFTPADYAALKHPLHALLVLSRYGSTRFDVTGRERTMSASKRRKPTFSESPAEELGVSVRGAGAAPSAAHIKKRATELLSDVVHFINSVIASTATASITPAVRAHAKLLAALPLEPWTTNEQSTPTPGTPLFPPRVPVEEGTPIPLRRYKGLLPIELAVRLHNVTALNAMIGEEKAGLEPATVVVVARTGVDGEGEAKVKVTVYRDAWFPDNDEYDTTGTEGVQLRTSAPTRRPLLHQALDYLPFPTPTRYMLHSHTMVKTFLLKYPHISRHCAKYVKRNATEKTQPKRTGFAAKTPQQEECNTALESIGVPWFPPGNHHYAAWARDNGAEFDIIHVLLRSSVLRPVFQVTGLAEDDDKRSLVRAVLEAPGDGELAVSRQYTRCGLFATVPLSLSDAETREDCVAVKVLHHDVEILRARLSPDLYLFEVREMLLKRGGVPASTLSLDDGAPLTDDCQLRSLAGGAGYQATTLFYEIQQHPGVWREAKGGCNLYTGRDVGGTQCLHAQTIMEPHWSCCGSTTRDSACSNREATRDFLFKNNPTHDDSDASSDKSSQEASGVESFPKKRLGRTSAAMEARWAKLGEMGLAKLFQRYPHLLHQNDDSCPGMASLREVLQNLITLHPFGNAEALDFAVAASFSPVLLESRHSWGRAFRAKPRVGKHHNDFEGFTDQPYNSGTPKMSPEPPGEQDLLLDVGLGLVHWAALLSCDSLLALTLDGLGLPLYSLEGSTTLPTVSLCLGYSGLCFAAYSAAVEVFDVAAAWSPAAELTGLALANHQHYPEEALVNSSSLSLGAYSQRSAYNTPRCSWCLAKAAAGQVTNPLGPRGGAARGAAHGPSTTSLMDDEARGGCERCTLLHIQIESRTATFGGTGSTLVPPDACHKAQVKYRDSFLRGRWEPRDVKGQGRRGKRRSRSASRSTLKTSCLRPFECFVLLAQWCETAALQVNCMNWEGGGGLVSSRAITPTTGDTPLMIACKFCHLHIVKKLLAFPTLRQDLQNGEGYDAHDIAVSLYHRDVIQRENYRAAGTVVNETCSDTQNPVMSSEGQMLKLVETLNSQPHIQDKLTQFTKSELRWSIHVMVFVLVIMVLVLTGNNEAEYLTSSSLATVLTTEEWNTATIVHPDGSEQGLRTFREDLSATLELEDLYAWFSEPFVSKLLGEEHLYGLFQLVGSVRIVKLTAEPKSCHDLFHPFLYGDSYLDSLQGVCYPQYTEDNLTPQGKQRWADWDLSYQSAVSLNTYPLHIGEYVDVSLDNHSIIKRLSGAEDVEQWVDHTTRFVTVYCTFYDPHVNLFVVGQIYFEIFAHGAIVPSYRFRSVRVNPYVNSSDGWRFAAELLATGFFVFHGVTEFVVLVVVIRSIIADIRRIEDVASEEEYVSPREASLSQRHGTMSKIWKYMRKTAKRAIQILLPVYRRLRAHVGANLLDLAVLIVQGIVTASLIEVRSLQKSLANDVTLLSTANGPDRAFHDSFIPLAWDTRNLNLWVGWLVLFATIRVFKPVSRIPRYGPIVKALISTMADQNLVIFGIVFGDVIVAFYFCMMAAFGSTTNQFRSPSSAAWTTFKMVLGDTEALPDMEKEHHVWGPFFFVLVIIFCQVVLLNLIVAVLQEIYVGANANAQRDWSMNVILSYKYYLTSVVDPAAVTAVLRDTLRKLRWCGISYPERALKRPLVHSLSNEWWTIPNPTIGTTAQNESDEER